MRQPSAAAGTRSRVPGDRSGHSGCSRPARRALVLWRDTTGTAHAFRDLCIHRGTALSLGTVRGRRARLPVPRLALRDERRVHGDPAARGPDARSRQGADRVLPLRRSATGSSGSLSRSRAGRCRTSRSSSRAAGSRACGPYAWRCDASRQVENFTDFGHFPWVHPGLLGDPDRPVVPESQGRTEGHVLHYDDRSSRGAQHRRLPRLRQRGARGPERRSRYELHLPYTIVLRLGWGGAGGMVYFFASPARRRRALLSASSLIARNYNLEQPDAVLQEFEDVIFDQDQRIVESQRPERVPFDLADELHLRSTRSQSPTAARCASRSRVVSPRVSLGGCCEFGKRATDDALRHPGLIEVLRDPA